MENGLQKSSFFARSPDASGVWRPISKATRALLPELDPDGVDSKNAWTSEKIGAHAPWHILLENQLDRPPLDPECVAVEKWITQQAQSNPVRLFGAPCAQRRKDGTSYWVHAAETQTLVIFLWGDGAWRVRPLEATEATAFDVEAKSHEENSSYFISFWRGGDYNEGADDEMRRFFCELALSLACESQEALEGFLSIAPSLGDWPQKAREKMARKEAAAIQRALPETTLSPKGTSAAKRVKKSHGRRL